MFYLYTYNRLVSGNQYKALAGTDEPPRCGQDTNNLEVPTPFCAASVSEDRDTSSVSWS